jgi:ATP-dependent DNA ligase
MKVMLCQPVTLEEARALCKTAMWRMERKYDGIRAYIEDGKLYDRRGKEISKRFPEFDVKSEALKGYVFDGEIVAESGIFEDVSGRVHLRDKFQIRLCAKMHPAVFVMFDALQVVHGVLDVNVPYALRAGPPGLGLKFSWMRFAEQYVDFEEVWKLVEENGWEGVVLKRVASFYQEGMRSPDWRKVKNFSEKIIEFTTYEIQPRGITMMTADGHRVVVNGGQANEVIEAFKKHGKVSAEIQYLPQKSGEMRFPSFRGLVEVQR